MTITATESLTWTQRYEDSTSVFRTVIDDGIVRIHIVAAAFPRKAKNTRVYVDGEDPAAESLALAEAASKAAGTYLREVSPEADKLWDKHNRELVRNKKAFLQELREEYELLDNLLAGRKLNFSRRGGCSCGCSPAFVADVRIPMNIMVEKQYGDHALEERYVVITDLFVAPSRKVEEEAK